MLDFWHYIIYIYIYDLQYAEYRIFLVIRNLSIIPKQKDSVFILIIFSWISVELYTILNSIFFLLLFFWFSLVYVIFVEDKTNDLVFVTVSLWCMQEDFDVVYSPVISVVWVVSELTCSYTSFRMFTCDELGTRFSCESSKRLDRLPVVYLFVIKRYANMLILGHLYW